MKRKLINYQSPIEIGGVYLVMGLVVMVIGTLATGGLVGTSEQKKMLAIEDKTSLSYLAAAKVAARAGDYRLAEDLALRSPVLGSNTDDEETIWPEKEILKEIDDLKSINEKTPSAAVWLRIAVNYWKIQDQEKAVFSYEEAKKIDPNSQELMKVKKLLGL